MFLMLMLTAESLNPEQKERIGERCPLRKVLYAWHELDVHAFLEREDIVVAAQLA